MDASLIRAAIGIYATEPDPDRAAAYIARIRARYGDPLADYVKAEGDKHRPA